MLGFHCGNYVDVLANLTLKTRTTLLHGIDTGGSGPPVLMLHGAGYSKAVFRKQLDSALAGRHRLIALDLPGHGDSPDAGNPGHDYTIRGFTETITEAIEQLGVERLVVFGWSLGGHIGFELLGHPMVAGVMASGAPPVSRGPIAMLRAFQTSWDMLLASKEKFSERDVLRFNHLCFPNGADGDIIEAVRRADGRARPILVRSLMRGDGVDERQAVEHAEVPVAIVHGEAEPFVRFSYVETLSYSTLWRGACHVIANAGHAVFWDQPERFNALLDRFAEDAAAYRQPVALPGRRSA
jgi:pimeloyl-ACP methyl ester carboxylesterase